MKGNGYVTVLGDWNAVVGESPEDECVGKFGLGSRNDRGQKLVEFCKKKPNDDNKHVVQTLKTAKVYMEEPWRLS